MANPFLSAIVPIYNGAHFLPEALESIRRQDYYPREIIVVDDGSTDDSAKVAEDFGSEIRFVRQEHAGPAAARNRGLSMARGELIAFLDADDLWPQGRLALQVERLICDPGLDIVLGRTRYIELPGGILPDIPFEGSERIVAHMTLGSAVFRKTVIEKIGMLDETLWFGEDEDWFMRAMELDVSMVILKEVTLLYRHHGSNMTREKDFRDTQLLVLRKSLERRRRLGLKNLRKWSEYDDSRKT